MGLEPTRRRLPGAIWNLKKVWRRQETNLFIIGPGGSVVFLPLMNSKIRLVIKSANCLICCFTIESSLKSIYPCLLQSVGYNENLVAT